MRLDERFARSDVGAHKHIEDFVGFSRVVDGNLLENAARRIHGRLPELFGVHFTETFVTLDVDFGRF